MNNYERVGNIYGKCCAYFLKLLFIRINWAIALLLQRGKSGHSPILSVAG